MKRESLKIARIAQLVEHDLAKVGVASSNPVSRSSLLRVVELVDTPDLQSCGHYARAGSSPASSTKRKLLKNDFLFFELCEIIFVF